MGVKLTKIILKLLNCVTPVFEKIYFYSFYVNFHINFPNRRPFMQLRTYGLTWKVYDYHISIIETGWIAFLINPGFVRQYFIKRINSNFREFFPLFLM